MSQDKKKILICGATGFIGRNMVEHFIKNDDFEVYGTYFDGDVLQNQKIKMIRADLTNREDVDRVIEGMDIVIQAAATTSGVKEIVEKPYYHVVDNAIMNSLIFKSAYDHDISHLIFFSCTVMYQPSDKALKEEDFDASREMLPSYFGAGWTKVYLEKLCEFYSRIGNTKYTVIRHSNIYGPYDKFDLDGAHVFGATVNKVLNSTDGKVVVWGTGEEKRDLLYVSDLVDFVEKAINGQKDIFGLYNVGYGESISITDLVKKVIKGSGLDVEIEYDKSKPTIKTKVFLDTAKAERDFGWKPKTPLEEGIRLTIDWYKQNCI